MKKIGILVAGLMPQAVQQTHVGYDHLFRQMLQAYDFDFESFFVVQDQFPDDLSLCDGWLITGSKHGAYEAMPWIKKLHDFVVQCEHQNQPLVGICFGHQVIANALGGVVKKAPIGWRIGRQLYHWKASSNLPLHGLAIHQDQVLEMPPKSTCILTSTHCPYAGIQYDQRKIISFQPHPEFSPDVTRQLLQEGGYASLSESAKNQGIESTYEPIDVASIIERIALTLSGYAIF